MAAAGHVFLLVALLSLAFAVAHNHSGETEIYHVSAGHLFVLKCSGADAGTDVTWSRVGRHSPSLPTGVEVRDGLLWFLPVQMSHNGSYICEKKNRTGLRIFFLVSVSSEECPGSSETISIAQGVSDGLPCKQREIFGLNTTRTIRWLKDCHPVKREGEPISVNEKGFMRLPKASEADAGKYTCLVDISLNGRKYTAARSVLMTITPPDPPFVKPEVVYPQHDVVVVKVGTRVELTCSAYLGYSEDSETSMYWTIGSDHTDDYKELKQSWEFIPDGSKVYGRSNLSISVVQRQFLNVPFQCNVENPAERAVGFMWLQEADNSGLHTNIALSLAASLTVLALAAAFFLFKVDLVLAYRKLLRHFVKQRAPDGKLYDAYVSFLHSDTLSSAETANFALQILPEELENQHGYSLYIRGRDDCPGEAVHDVIAAKVCQCRRLIIILSPKAKISTHGEKEGELLRDDQNQLWYEHKIGLYDALIQNDLRVILVEIDGPVDYSCLPESLRYIKKKQGSLKWRKPSAGTHKLTKFWSNRNFWKNLRYYMPSVPTGRLNTIISSE